MALTAKQRRRLPRSAFALKGQAGKRSTWRYPVPTKAHARRAGISEAQRQRTLTAAKAYASRRTTAGSPRHVHAVANRRRAR